LSAYVQGKRGARIAAVSLEKVTIVRESKRPQTSKEGTLILAYARVLRERGIDQHERERRKAIQVIPYAR